MAAELARAVTSHERSAAPLRRREPEEEEEVPASPPPTPRGVNGIGIGEERRATTAASSVASSQRFSAAVVRTAEDEDEDSDATPRRPDNEEEPPARLSHTLPRNWTAQAPRKVESGATWAPYRMDSYVDATQVRFDSNGRMGASSHESQVQTDPYHESYSSVGRRHEHSFSEDDRFSDSRLSQHSDLNGYEYSSRDDPHIAAILRDASMIRSVNARADPRPAARSPSPSKRLTHYSSADEILQRFSEKWKKYQESTSDHAQARQSSESQATEEMPGATRKRIPVSNSKLKRPSELEQLRQENSRLKKKIQETEQYYNEQVASLSTALDDGKKLWERTNKDNVELRARAEVDALKMQRLEDRIRLLESAMRQPPGGLGDDSTSLDGGGAWADHSLRRIVDTQEKELQVLRKEIEVYQHRQHLGHQPAAYSASSATDHQPQQRDAWGSGLDLHAAARASDTAPSTSYTRLPSYTVGGFVLEDRLPKQYRSTGDLRAATSSLPRSSASQERSSGAAVRQSSGVGSSTGAPSMTLSSQKIYWVDDPPMEEPIRRPTVHHEPTFEPPKVHPMIVKMATKRKRNERSKTIGYGDLRRSRSDDRQASASAARATNSSPPPEQRSRPAWVQRVLNLRKSSAEDDRGGGAGDFEHQRSRARGRDTKPPTPDRPRPGARRQAEPAGASVFCRGRLVPADSGADSGSSEGAEFEARPGPRPASAAEAARPPTSVLIESIRARVREFNAQEDGRRSAEPPGRPERTADEGPARPASSLELRGRREVGFAEEAPGEDDVLKQRVAQTLERQAARWGPPGGVQEELRPPAHGPVRAVHAARRDSGSEASLEAMREGEQQERVPPLDLSRLTSEKITPGSGLPTDMRNYADELIKKYMSSLATNNEQ